MAFNYTKLNENTLLVKDPVHNEIIVEYPFSKIVLSKEMLRLGNITQNGFSQYEFEGLKNNDRLSHSVGAFHIMKHILERLKQALLEYNIEISKDDIDIALCSILLHDIGHGPFSHSLELITNYSHEKRTSDILLGDTEVGNLLTNLFGRKKVKQIASFIAEINDNEEISKDSFTKLLKNLVSHQLDADRIDYLLRDAYYVDLSSAISVKKIIENMNVIVNEDQEYELLIDRKGLSSIENVLLQRYQMYRDVYLSPTAILGDVIFKNIIERYKSNTFLHSLPVTKQFRILAIDNEISDLYEFLDMSDEDFKKSFDILKNNKIDLVIAYLCDFANLGDYILIENMTSPEKIKEYLKMIFKDEKIDSTLSIISHKIKSKLYKKEQSLNIQFGNRIADISDCTNLIRPQEELETVYTFFNPELLRLELGFSKEEWKKYEGEVNKMIKDLNKKPEEFELKYIIEKEESIETLLERLINLFKKNGFRTVSVSEKLNNDEYYDTSQLDLYKSGGSLRIRKASAKGKTKYKGTYKTPLGEGEVYSSREEYEESLLDDKFDTFESKMKESQVPVDFSRIVNFPILNSSTNRMVVLLEKNGVLVELALDKTLYTNHILNVQTVDSMIEIEAAREIKDRVILNEIHSFISGAFDNLSINKQSKYERGVDSTIESYNQTFEDGSSKSKDAVFVMTSKIFDSKN